MRDQWMAPAQAWLRGHAGIVSVEPLRRFGRPRREAYRLVERGEFGVIMPGVLRSLQWPLGDAQLMMAACARDPRALIAFTTAARQWNFRGAGKDSDVHVLVPHGTSPTLPGVVVHRCRRIDEVDVVRRADGTRLTSPPRTLFDCADIFGTERTASVLEQMLDESRGTMATYASTVARLASPSRPGTRTMRSVIVGRQAWRTAVQSELERSVLAEIERQGLPTPVVQFRVTTPDGQTVRFDFAWPHLLLALEVDHPFWHAGVTQSDRDKRRDRVVATLGWQTLRITDLDVHTGLPRAVRDLAAVMMARAAHFRTAG